MALDTTLIPFTGNPLDRASDKRTDPNWLAEQFQSAQVIPFWRGMPFVYTPQEDGGFGDPGWMDPAVADMIPTFDQPPVFLGLGAQGPYFALEADPNADMEADPALSDLGRFEDMRGAAGALALPQAAVLGQAKALIEWRRKHRFCSNCGAPTEQADGGYKRACDNCGTEHFPRTDPVVIMLAEHDDQVLMGRGAGWPEGFYSALAGFVEHGETLEAAAARELKEEAGVEAKSVRYLFNQPWPFPNSLMIGMIAEAAERVIHLADQELEDARWFTLAEARALMDGTLDGVYCPPPVAIAHHLLKAWVDERA